VGACGWGGGGLGGGGRGEGGCVRGGSGAMNPDNKQFDASSRRGDRGRRRTS